MTIEVLGLGESIKNYKPNGNITIGVNDIYKYVKTDYIVMVDPPNRFNEADRLKTIMESTPKKFYCNHVWNVPNFELITLASPRGELGKLDTKEYCYSNNSAFVACILAYKMKAKEIVLHGVDFVNHNQLCHQNNLNRIIKDFTNLRNEFERRNVKLYVSSSYSLLSKILQLKSS